MVASRAAGLLAAMSFGCGPVAGVPAQDGSGSEATSSLPSTSAPGASSVDTVDASGSTAGPPQDCSVDADCSAGSLCADAGVCVVFETLVACADPPQLGSSSNNVGAGLDVADPVALWWPGASRPRVVQLDPSPDARFIRLIDDTYLLDPPVSLPDEVVAPVVQVSRDFDGDGADDLAIADGGRRLSIALGGGHGGVHPPDWDLVWSWDELAHALVAGDWNADGRVDFVSVHDSRMQVWINDGGATFTIAGELDAEASAVVAGELGPDPGDEIVVLDASLRVLAWVDGALVERSSLPLATHPVPHEVSTPDLDADGDTDIVRIRPFEDGMAVTLWPSVGDGTFEAARYFVGAGSAFGPTTVADLDGDGDHDLLALEHAPTPLSFTVVFGGPSGPECAHAYEAPSQVAGPVAAADFSGDGRTDVAFASDGAVVLWKQ